MSGIDKQFVREYYQRMTDQEVIRILTTEAAGLTPVALEVVNEEIKRRNLDPELLRVVDAQQKAPAPEAEFIIDPNGCPVDEPTRIYLEQSFLTLLNIFGEEETVNRNVLLPNRTYFPVKYDGSKQAAFETLKIVARQMEVPVESIKLDFIDENLQHITDGNPGGMYWGKGETGKFEISLALSKLDEPENMVATLAHEIAHIKLLGENRIAENNEPLTDLATIFFGLGVFNANAAYQVVNSIKYRGWSKSGYLTQWEWGYALALFSYIRQEKQPDWVEHLSINVKADFRRGQRFIYDNEDLLFLPR